MLRFSGRRAIIPSVRALFAILLLTAGCGGFDYPKPRHLPPGISFNGTWESTWGKMVLRQGGKQIHGTFTGYREGGLSGELEGDVWHFIWDQRNPHSHGRGFMQLSPDGQHIEGRWGYMPSDNDGGRWAADKENGDTL
jgi:hypothetical protein